MKDEAQQPRPPYTRSPLYLLGQIDSLDPMDRTLLDNVRTTIIRMMELLREAEDAIRGAAASGWDDDEDVADRIVLFLRGEEELVEGRISTGRAREG